MGVQLAQTPSELASAGFFYTGCGDKVRCFSGGCGLEMWEPGDKPRLEHSKWYPDCSFVRMLEEIDTENTGYSGNNENTGYGGNNENTENKDCNGNKKNTENKDCNGNKKDTEN